jgi:hypothetical protein
VAHGFDFVSHNILIDSQGEFMYTIRITYKTGNSYGTYDERDFVGYAWNSFDRTVQAAELIVEHNQYFTAKDDFSRQQHGATSPEINELFEQHGEWSVPVESDDGKIFEIDVFWRGYFEELRDVTVTETDEYR